MITNSMKSGPIDFALRASIAPPLKFNSTQNMLGFNWQKAGEYPPYILRGRSNK